MDNARRQHSPEVRARAVRMVEEHRSDHASQRGAIVSISSKIGCTAETLRRWIKDSERRSDPALVAVTDDKARLRVLERENRELRQANEILRKASAYFAQGEEAHAMRGMAEHRTLDRPFSR